MRLQALLRSAPFLGGGAAPLRRARAPASPAAAPPPPRRAPAPLRVAAQARRGLSELLSLNAKEPDPAAAARAPLRQAAVSPPRPVPAHIPRPPYASTGRMPGWDERVQSHDAAGLIKMRTACRLAAEILNKAGAMVRPGVTTDAIDAAVHGWALEAGAYPSPLNYGGFPKSVCTSVNECICHGIPDARPLAEGDIVNVDVTVFLDGYHGDTSRMFYVGAVSDAAKKLCEATDAALAAGIAACGPGRPLRGIGAAIQQVADAGGYGISKSFVGHGVGTVFHSAPHVVHVRNAERGDMVPGMTFTIEPILCEGSPRERVWKDNWTAVTVDGGLAAQREHTLLITETGVEILTVAE